MIFIESALGCEATSIASTACSMGKRCEIKLRQIESIAITAENQLGYFIENTE